MMQINVQSFMHQFVQSIDSYKRNLFIKLDIFEVYKLTLVRYNEYKRRVARTFDFVRDFNDGLALALLHSELTTALQLSTLATDFTIIGHLHSVEDQLMLSTAQILDLDSLVGLDSIPVKEEDRRRRLILEFHIQHQFLPLHGYRILQFLVETIRI